MRGPQGTVLGFTQIVRDVSERQAAQQALQSSERQFKLLVDGISEYALYMLDPSGIITNWNTGAERIKGYRADEIIGQHFGKFYSQEDRRRGAPAAMLRRRAATAAARPKDGASGKAAAASGPRSPSRPSTTRMASWSASGRSRATSPSGAKRSRHCSTANASSAARHRRGGLRALHARSERNHHQLEHRRRTHQSYTADEILGQHFSKFYRPSDRLAGMPAQALYKATLEGRHEAEGWRVRKDGTQFWASVVIDSIRDEHGALIGFAKITRDITERAKHSSRWSKRRRRPRMRRRWRRWVS